MGYRSAIEAAGEVVMDFKEFGSYQGTWIAVLENGFVIEGSYGSCSGCDAFQSEFDCNSPTQEDLAKFGQSYLPSKETFSSIINRYREKCNDNYAWEDDKEILNWLEGLITKSGHFKNLYNKLNEIH